jgi:hypothetical protein
MLVIVLIVIMTVVLLIGMDRVSGQNDQWPTPENSRRPNPEQVYTVVSGPPESEARHPRRQGFSI